MKVAIIKYSNLPTKASFMKDENGNRLLFNSHDDADNYLMKYAESGVAYKHYDGED